MKQKILLNKLFLPYFLLVLIASLTVTGVAFSSTSSRIELDDGTVIVGTIVSFEDGEYRVKTERLGTISLSENSVLNIQRMGSSGSAASSKAGNNGSGAYDLRAEQQQIQNRLMGSPETVGIIESLQNNPAMQNILNNPDLMKAITQGDLETLGRSPDIQALMKNPKVRDIIEKNQ
ncbi:MAG: hypothetical protein COV66_02205 [Nitrospinae bacterium CG11_big_fil_rev_8_21_14_0_20_45_15]|nr:MAG: hypothetical protein COV66_02205 [Nitrospinae bacterium CG11_big_fil_rev_8_21_14_0_20_45_15]